MNEISISNYNPFDYFEQHDLYVGWEVGALHEFVFHAEADEIISEDVCEDSLPYVEKIAEHNFRTVTIAPVDRAYQIPTAGLLFGPEDSDALNEATK